MAIKSVPFDKFGFRHTPLETEKKKQKVRSEIKKATEEYLKRAEITYLEGEKQVENTSCGFSSFFKSLGLR